MGCGRRLGGDPSGDVAQGLKAALRRTLPARWGLVSGTARPAGPPSVLDALAEALGEDSVRIDGAMGEEATAQALDELLDEGSPLVLVGEEAGFTWVLRALPNNAMLRERVHAVVSIGGVIGGRSDEPEGPLSVQTQRDWLGAHFRMKALETDVVRLTPYFALQWLDRDVEEPGIEGLSLSAMRFPEPPADASASTVEVVDLGPLPVDPELPRDLVARALVVCVTAWVANRR